MNNKHILKSILCLLLCVCCLISVSACGEEPEKQKGERQDDEYRDDLPDDLDFEGQTVNVFYFDSSFLRNELTADGSTGDVVDLAVDRRNLSVEERLNVQLNYIAGDIAAEIFSAIALEEILSGSDDYDVVIGTYYEECKSAVQGIYRDLSHAKYIDYSKDYWNDNYINTLSLYNRKYMLVGDISLSLIKSCATTTFDLKTFENTFGSVEDFYDMVLSGDGNPGGWTYDVMAEYCRKSYVDLNGNGLYDTADQYGFSVGSGSSIIDYMMFSSGVQLSHRDEKNLPVIDLTTEKFYNFFNYFYRFMYENPGVFLVSDKFADDAENTKSVFTLGTMQDLVSMRAEENDFGVIPYPKFYENDTQYHAATAPYTFAVPITIASSRVPMVCAVLECMASEGRRICVPAYYEIALKDKYTRDDTSVTMIDIIHKGASTDFLCIYSEVLGGTGTFLRHLIQYEEPDFVSWYAAKQPMINAKLDELLKNAAQGYKPE